MVDLWNAGKQVVLSSENSAEDSEISTKYQINGTMYM